MKGLTLKQPWAHAIMYLRKDVENRNWEPPDSLIGKYIAIHAGKGFVNDSGLDVKRSEMTRSAIVGIARIGGVVTRSSSKWFEGDFGWLLEDVRRLKKPIARSGSLGLWNVKPDELRKLQQEFPWLEEDGSRAGRRKVAAAPSSEHSLTPGQKAARTRKANAARLARKRSAAGRKAALTRKRRAAGRKAAVTRRRREAARKAAETRRINNL